MSFFGFGRKKSCCTAPATKSSGKPIGRVSHYYDKIGVAIVDLKGTLSKGDMVKFVRGDEAFEQTIDSMQLEHAEIERAGRGKSVGVKVSKKVHEGAEVYKV